MIARLAFALLVGAQVMVSARAQAQTTPTEPDAPASPPATPSPAPESPPASPAPAPGANSPSTPPSAQQAPVVPPAPASAPAAPANAAAPSAAPANAVAPSAAPAPIVAPQPTNTNPPAPVAAPVSAKVLVPGAVDSVAPTDAGQPEPEQAPQRRIETDERWFTLGVGPLVLGNYHWLDKPDDKRVTVRSASSTDERYPGFAGADVTIGLMIDARFWHFIGVELDIFRQDDHGRGIIKLKDAGSLCFLPGAAIPYGTKAYDVSIGQSAWHLPLLFKLTIPGPLVTVVEREERDDRDEHDGRAERDGRDSRNPDADRDARNHVEVRAGRHKRQPVEVERRIRKWFLSFAFGPEFVIPGHASLAASPDGLDFPIRAKASNYLMYTGAIGFERRLSDRYDIRLLGSLRGSYNPGPGDSAMKRGEYDLVNARIMPITYISEWRYQAALTLGAGWFF